MMIGSPPRHQSPLASPRSPGDMMPTSLGRRPSTASLRSIDGVKEDDAFIFVRSYAKAFCNKMTQILVQSRQNENYDTKGSASPGHTWWNLELEEIGEVTVHVKKAITNFPPTVPCFSLDFILYTSDGDTLPLETWCFSYESSMMNPFNSRLTASELSDIKSKLYYNVGTLVRSVLCAARMTPMHRYYVKNQSAQTYVITYRVLEGRSSIELGSDCKRRQIGQVDVPGGTFYLTLAYRTNMEINRAVTPGSNESFQQIHISPGNSPPTAGTPSSYCDILSQFSASPPSQIASPPSRSRAVSEATSEGGFPIGPTGGGPMAIHVSGSAPVLREKRTSGGSESSSERCPLELVKEHEHSKSSSDLKERQKRADEDEEDTDSDDDDDMIRSRARIADDIPFRQLLLSSYTGVLLTHGLSPALTASIAANATGNREEDSSSSSTSSSSRTTTSSVKANVTSSGVNPLARSTVPSAGSGSGSGSGSDPDEEEEEGSDVNRGGLSEELTSSLMSTSSRTVTAERRGCDDGEEEDVMSETLKDDNMILGRSLLSSIALRPIGEQDEREEEEEGDENKKRPRQRSGDVFSDSSSSEEDDEDSFVRVTPFFCSAPPEENLADTISQFKDPTEIEGIECTMVVGELYNRAAELISEFSSMQGTFDRLVADVREAVEEDERREREGDYGRLYDRR